MAETTELDIGAEKEQAQVFGKFYRSQSVADRQEVGIGLYLADFAYDTDFGTHIAARAGSLLSLAQTQQHC